jgi:Zn-finger nucleic acid-binding protein
VTQEKATDLFCPACGYALVSKQFLDETVEKCFECGGMWFDADELRRAQERKDDSIVWPENLLGYAEKLKVRSDRKINCPKDGAELVSLHYGPSEVVVDVCPKCRGVWFDHGEFNRVVEDLEDASVSKTSLEYLKDVAHEIAEVLTGEKSFSEELADVRKTWHLFKNRLAIDHPFLENFVEALGKTFT